MPLPPRFPARGLRRFAAAIAGMGLFALAPSAGAVTFSITDAVLAIGTGYGKDGKVGKERSGDLLGVKFSDSFSSHSFSLDAVGQAFAFELGTVRLIEPEWFVGISTDEIDGLDVSWTLSLDGPLRVNQVMHAAASAAIGKVNRDAAVDYALDWSPVTVDFGRGGKFEIDLNDLEFKGRGKRTQAATITLLSLPTPPTLQVPPPAASVPEPGTIALLALGLAGIGAARRLARYPEPLV